jgi:hypothetical protein
MDSEQHLHNCKAGGIISHYAATDNNVCTSDPILEKAQNIFHTHVKKRSCVTGIHNTDERTVLHSLALKNQRQIKKKKTKFQATLQPTLRENSSPLYVLLHSTAIIKAHIIDLKA